MDIGESLTGMAKEAKVDLGEFLTGMSERAAVQSTVWSRPGKAWAEEDATSGWIVRWGGGGGGGPVDLRAAQDRLLTEFISLADATPQEVASFVESWGILDLCRHGLPNTHLPLRMWPDLDSIGARPCAAIWGGPNRAHFEPVERWHHFARQAASLHRAARLILAGRRVPEELWGTMEDLYPTGWILGDQEPAAEAAFGTSGGVRLTESVEATEYRLMTHALQRWLNMGDVGIQVRWERAQGTIRFGGTGLIGAIALQLALTCTKTRSFFTCSACGLPYTPTRKPRSGENHYCQDCRAAGRPAADRMNRLRAKRATLPPQR